MSMKNCMVAQSGGPTATINASLAGVIDAVLRTGCYDKVYGALNGITGVMDGKYIDLGEIAGADESLIPRLKATPAMYLGSCRYQLPHFLDDDSAYVSIFKHFAEQNVGAFFYIGGNDSMDTAQKLAEYGERVGSGIRVIGIPKTIDNDLCATDHTPGFGSAARYVATSMLEIAHDSLVYPTKSVTIVEIMGRDAGWLTAASALARNSYSDAPHLIYLPEVPFHAEDFLLDIKHLLFTQNSVVAAVSEGIRDASGKYVSATEQSFDTFGHSQLSGAGKTLEYLVKEKLGIKVRSVELNVLQRCGAHLASGTDQEESFALGAHAVNLASNGMTGEMVTIRRGEGTPYTVSYSHAPLKNVADKTKMVPTEWISESGNDVKQPLIDYVAPLICGEPSVVCQDGLPVYEGILKLTNTQ